MLSLPGYVIITPAHNEAAMIGRTLESVVAQTVQPLRWVIVDDGSTDGTAEIVRPYVEKYAWIEIITRPRKTGRDFAGKARAFQEGYASVRDLDAPIIVNLDADLEFAPDLFEFLLAKFNENPSLGVWGPVLVEDELQYDYRYSNIQNVAGPCQMFRRACFDEIGGYSPMEGGGIDHLAVVSARMCGWTTQTFSGKMCIHQRVMGTAQRGKLRAKFFMGMKDYSLGNHPLWQASRALYQMTRPPYLIGGFALGSGYLWAAARGRRRVDSKVREFIRREQLKRLRRFVLRGSSS